MPGRRPTREERRRHRERVIDYARERKLERGCQGCGYREHPDALEFDHLVEGGGHAYKRVRTFAWVDSMMEDPGVQVLCGNCHNIKSRAAQRRPRGGRNVMTYGELLKDLDPEWKRVSKREFVAFCSEVDGRVRVGGPKGRGRITAKRALALLANK